MVVLEWKSEQGIISDPDHKCGHFACFLGQLLKEAAGKSPG
jgi:hypothetical protein